MKKFKFKIGDRVQLISDLSSEYEHYIGHFAIIIDIDDAATNFPYEINILNYNNKLETLWWEEKGLQLTTPVLVHETSETNLRKFNEIDSSIIKAAEVAGITKEQAYKFMGALE